MAITITCCILSAHLVALGTSFAWYALIGSVLLLHALWYYAAHSRLMAWVYGLTAAFYLLVLVEIYLGATGLYHGAIGSLDRPDLFGDRAIVTAFTAFYHYGKEYVSLISWVASLVLYGVVSFFRDRPTVSRFADVLACVLAFFGVLLAFRFTQPFTEKHVGVIDAMFDASAAVRTLGSYSASAKEVAKEADRLQQLSSELEDPKLAEKRKLLSDEVRRYADLLVVLDEHKQRMVEILRRPTKDYQPSTALPEEGRRYPPRPERDFSPRDAEPDAINVGVEDILHAAFRQGQAKQMAEAAKRDQARGDESYRVIRAFVREILFVQLGKGARSDLFEISLTNVVRIIVLHDIDEAIAELKARVARLDEEIRSQAQQNAELERRVREYTTKLSADLQRQFACGSVLQDVATWGAGDGRFVVQTIGNRYREAGPRLDGRRPDLAPNVAPRGANVPVITDQLVQPMVRDNRWPPGFTREQMTAQLLRVSESGAGLVSAFAEAMCRAGRDADDIKRELQTVADQVRLPEPKPEPVSPR